MCLLLPGMDTEVLEHHGTQSDQHMKPTGLICMFASVFMTLVALAGVGFLLVACYLKAEAQVACSIRVSTTGNYIHEMVIKVLMCNGELYQT